MTFLMGLINRLIFYLIYKMGVENFYITWDFFISIIFVKGNSFFVRLIDLKCFFLSIPALSAYIRGTYIEVVYFESTNIESTNIKVLVLRVLVLKFLILRVFMLEVLILGLLVIQVLKILILTVLMA